LTEYVDILHYASLGPGDSSLYKWSPWGHKWPHLKGS